MLCCLPPAACCLLLSSFSLSPAGAALARSCHAAATPPPRIQRDAATSPPRCHDATSPSSHTPSAPPCRLPPSRHATTSLAQARATQAMPPRVVSDLSAQPTHPPTPHTHWLLAADCLRLGTGQEEAAHVVSGDYHFTHSRKSCVNRATIRESTM